MVKDKLLGGLLVTLFVSTTLVYAVEDSKKPECENVNPITGQCEDKAKEPVVSTEMFI